MDFYSLNKEDVILFLKIIPGSAANSITGTINYNEQNFLKIKLKEKAIEGKANKALIKFLSKFLERKESDIQILKGETSPYKQVFIKKIDLAYLNFKIKPYIL